MTTCVGLRYGTARSLFLAPASPDCRFGRGPRVLSRASARFNALFRQCAPGTRTRRFHRARCTGMLTRLPSASPRRVRLRSRLTLIRLALIRKPRSIGGPVSRRPCRYSCLHLLFQTLQRGSRPAFAAVWNAPLPLHPQSLASAPRLMPVYHRRPAARPVSCYALFKGIAASKLTSWLSLQLDRLCPT